MLYFEQFEKSGEVSKTIIQNVDYRSVQKCIFSIEFYRKQLPHILLSIVMQSREKTAFSKICNFFSKKIDTKPARSLPHCHAIVMRNAACIDVLPVFFSVIITAFR